MKAEDEAPLKPAESEERKSAKVLHLLAALNASVIAAKEACSEHGEEATVREMRPARGRLRRKPSRPRRPRRG